MWAEYADLGVVAHHKNLRQAGHPVQRLLGNFRYAILGRRLPGFWPWATYTTNVAKQSAKETIRKRCSEELVELLRTFCRHFLKMRLYASTYPRKSLDHMGLTQTCVWYAWKMTRRNEWISPKSYRFAQNELDFTRNSLPKIVMAVHNPLVSTHYKGDWCSNDVYILWYPCHPMLSPWKDGFLHQKDMFCN